jgi:hypothetical protein
MINKHENISVGVYWDDVGVPGWKLSGWSNTRSTISSKNCEKYSRSTLGVTRYLRSYWDRRADAGCCVLLRAPAQERRRKSEGPTPRCTNITTIIFPQISKPWCINTQTWRVCCIGFYGHVRPKFSLISDHFIVIKLYCKHKFLPH